MKRRIAIVGAGISGLRLGQILTRHGHAVTLFEKARAAGGRIATRRADFGQFDHGAPYLTVSTPEFAKAVDDWKARGVVSEWAPRIARLHSTGVEAQVDPSVRWVGVPTMTAIPRDLARDLDLRCETRVASVRRAQAGWIVVRDDGFEFPAFDFVFAATPAAQAIPIVGASAALAPSVRGVEFRACHALMLSFAAPLAVEFDAAHVADSAISWMARESSKPGRQPSNRWVVQSSAEWSEANLELQLDRVERLLLDALGALLPAPLPPIEGSSVHRWLFARATKPIEDHRLIDGPLGLGVCGDWLRGDGIEAAYLSAEAAAREFLATND